MSAATDPPEPDVELILRPVADPITRHGKPARDSAYRLRLALKVLGRNFGLRAVSVRDVPPDPPPGAARRAAPGSPFKRSENGE